jgi:hypothetical protein
MKKEGVCKVVGHVYLEKAPDVCDTCGKSRAEIEAVPYGVTGKDFKAEAEELLEKLNSSKQLSWEEMEILKSENPIEAAMKYLAFPVISNRTPSFMNMAVMQPTVTNKSEPVDLNYLYLVLSKRPRVDFDFPGITKLTQKVSKLGDAFMMDQTPGSGFFAKAEVDLIIVDILEQVLTMIIERDISMDTAFKHITFPKGFISTAKQLDKEGFMKAWREPGIVYQTPDARHPLTKLEIDQINWIKDPEVQRVANKFFPKKIESDFDTEQSIIIPWIDCTIDEATQNIIDWQKWAMDHIFGNALFETMFGRSRDVMRQLNDNPDNLKQYPLRPEECYPAENIIDGEDNHICRHSRVLNYQSCPDYNTEFCKKQCEHGRKEEEV